MNAITRVLAPVEFTEQYPTHYGAALTTLVVTSQLRNAETGYRQSYVDMLTDLLEGDPHAAGVLRKLFASIANRPWTLAPADVEDESKLEQAEQVAAFVRSAIAKIPAWNKHVTRLLWGWFYGASCAEVMWRRTPDAWLPVSLASVHSRRVAYDEDFEPYLSDVEHSTTGPRFNDFPAKFILFEPCVTGDYPTREGLGRWCAYWLAFKRFTMRDFVGYAERFGKPFPIATWSTSDSGTPRPADSSEVAVAKELVVKIGRGGSPGAALPDSIKLDLIKDSAGTGGSGENTVHKALIALCNEEFSKMALGGTLTTDVGKSGGNRALGEVQSREQGENKRAIAAQLDETITTRLVWWIVALNYGADVAEEMCPRYCTDVNDPDDQESLSLVLEKLTGMGLKVAVSEVRERFGWRAPVEDEEVLGEDDAEEDTQPPPEPQMQPDEEPEETE